MSRVPLLLLLLVVVGFTADGSTVQRAATTADTTARAVAAANAFLGTLDEAKRAKAAVPLNAKSRSIWSNLPTGMTMQTGATERNGVKLGDLSAAQQEAALALVAAALSPTGFQKVMDIVNADEVLEIKSAPARPATNRIRFGRGEFYVAILGKPSVTEPWLIQFGGHHLAINVTVAGRQNVLTPSHTGTQPATYTLEGRTVRPLGQENDKAFALMNALNAEQQKEALLGYEVRNIVLGPGEDGKVIQPEGIPASKLTADQRAMLLALVREWVGILDGDAATAKMSEVDSNLSKTYFAWSGSTTNGRGAYFRVQGPTVLIEYAPQGSGGTNTDHIHTIYRDPTNDYGARFAKP